MLHSSRRRFAVKCTRLRKRCRSNTGSQAEARTLALAVPAPVRPALRAPQRQPAQSFPTGWTHPRCVHRSPSHPQVPAPDRSRRLRPTAAEAPLSPQQRAPQANSAAPRLLPAFLLRPHSTEKAQRRRVTQAVHPEAAARSNLSPRPSRSPLAHGFQLDSPEIVGPRGRTCDLPNTRIQPGNGHPENIACLPAHRRPMRRSRRAPQETTPPSFGDRR
jgi:hypothetical protein